MRTKAKKHSCRGILPVAAALFLSALASPQVVAQTGKGIDLYNAWKYEEAEAALKAAPKADAQNLYYLGLTLLQQEKFNEALANLRDSEALMRANPGTEEPDDYQLQVAFARARIGLKQFPEAQKSLDAAEKLLPGSIDVYVYRGLFYLEQGKVAESIKELDKALELDGQNPYANYYAGQAYLRAGNPARAVELLKTFLSLTPEAPEAPKARVIIDALC